MSAILPAVLTGAGGLFGAASSVAGGAAQANALETQGEIARAQNQLDAQIFEKQADWERRAGKIQANQIHLAGEQLVGQQKAGYAAGNIDVNTGTPADVQGDTRFLTKLDELMAQNNAWMRASGFRLGASQRRFAGESAYLSGRTAAGATRLASFLDAGGTLLGTAGNLIPKIGRWREYQD